MTKIWHIIVLVLHRYYPPRLFVFYPLYKTLRRRLRIPMAYSNLGVWLISAILHGLVVGLVTGPAPGVVFFSIFLFLGVLSTAVIVTSKPACRRPRRKASAPTTAR